MKKPRSEKLRGLLEVQEATGGRAGSLGSLAADFLLLSDSLCCMFCSSMKSGPLVPMVCYKAVWKGLSSMFSEISRPTFGLGRHLCFQVLTST